MKTHFCSYENVVFKIDIHLILKPITPNKAATLLSQVPIGWCPNYSVRERITPHLATVKHALTLFHEISCLFKEKEEARLENFNKTVGQESRYIFSERNKRTLTHCSNQSFSEIHASIFMFLNIDICLLSDSE